MTGSVIGFFFTFLQVTIYEKEKFCAQKNRTNGFKEFYSIQGGIFGVKKKT